MNADHLKIIDLITKSAVNESYSNTIIAAVNDHVVRLSVMTEPFFWHFHPNSDESFLVIEGSLFIDLEDSTVELLPNQLFTIPANVLHRTRPGSHRSVNLTFESAAIDTIKVAE